MYRVGRNILIRGGWGTQPDRTDDFDIDKGKQVIDDENKFLNPKPRKITKPRS